MAKSQASQPSEVMVVNDLPGEECRIGIVREQHLEELYTERTSQATSVGNIYKGKVSKVEPAIQAAFVDFGGRQSGFLHITDLHPRYFPGKERAERVGKKIPRRDRPPMQDCLKRGDEVLVQVLKEGIGTKGPTLTSYLSIPGRHMVMMPGMNKVGVSRKVEDDEQRRAMRKILDSLDLPDECGFILRTAGLGQNKTELKRDVAYLTRLWKVMDKRIKKVGAPCALYTESDLLIRTIRDVLRPSIEAVVVDSESAHQRASDFLHVVAPRSAPNVIRYTHPTPIFHAFDIERQIELIHNREVPLPSGGALVIEQTEAMVSIDVNSGRSRAARDSETNAYRTNCEAVDEICRQLRLRDLGGLIVHDLIDMRMNRHRRAIEDRFRENLKRDRAKSTVLKISEFGLVEMTRQRMRPSLRKAHFMDCPHCNGRGEIKIPESVAADAIRQVGYLLQYDRISRVELVCAPRVATVLLSTKRREMVRLEDASGKSIDVRVSDAFAIDHTEYYAYDERNADVDIEKLNPLPRPNLDALRKAAEQAESSGEMEPATTDGEGDKKKKKRRRRRRGGGPADAAAMALSGGYAMPDEEGQQKDEATVNGQADDASPDSGEQKSRRRRRRRRGRGGKGKAAEQADQPNEAEQRSDASDNDGAQSAEEVAAPDKTTDSQPIRVHRLAKELSVRSKEIVSRCQAEDMPVKNHMSTLTAEQADVVRGWFTTSPDQSDADEAAAGENTKQPRDEGRDSDQEQERAGGRSGKRSRRGGRRRRRGGRSKGGGAEATGGDEQGSSAAQSTDAPADAGGAASTEAGAEPRGGRGKQKKKKKKSASAGEAAPASHAQDDASPADPKSDAPSSGRKKKQSKKKSSSGRGGDRSTQQASGESSTAQTGDGSTEAIETGKRSSGRKRSGRTSGKGGSTKSSADNESGDDAAAPEIVTSSSSARGEAASDGQVDESKGRSSSGKSQRRTLYRNRRKPVRVPAEETEVVDER